MALKPFTGTLDEPDSAAAGLKPFDGSLDGEKSGLIRRLAGDTAVTALKSAIAVPEAAVGLADIASGGRAGKAVQDLGVDFKRAKSIADEWYSPEQQQANRNLREAEGFVGTLQAAAENPSAVLHAVGESVGPMLAGGAVARALGPVASLNPLARGAIGEGAVSAGMQAEQTRQGTADGTLTPQQSLAAAGSGVGTGLITRLSGGLAKKLGIEDVDTLLAGGTTTAGKVGMAKRVGQGLLTEGVLEEMPQSAQEQVWQNYAEDRPLMEGVPESAALGMLTGGVMGGGVNALRTGGDQPTPTPQPAPAIDPNAGPLSRAAATAQQTGAAGLAQEGQAVLNETGYLERDRVSGQAVSEDGQAVSKDPLAGLSARLTPQNMRAIRTAEGYGPESVNEVLRAYQIARNPEMDANTRQQATEALNSFWQGFDNRPNWTRPNAQPEQAAQPGTEVVPFGAQGTDVAAPGIVPPFDPNTLDGQAREVGTLPRQMLGGPEDAAAQYRRELLDSVLADPDTRNPLSRYESVLKKNGFEQRRATPEERKLIEDRTVSKTETVPARAEMPSFGSVEQARRAAFPMTQTGAQRQAAERTQATGQAFEVVPHPTVKGRFAVQAVADQFRDATQMVEPVVAANTSPERVAQTPEIEQVAPTNSLSRTASWVIRDKATGEAVMETFDRKKVDALNTDKYEAVPIQEHLASLNRQPTNALLNAGEISSDEQRYQSIKQTPPVQRSTEDVAWANEYRAKQSAPAQREAAEQAEQQRAKQNDTDGFAEAVATGNAMRQAKVRNALNQIARFNGTEQPRKEAVRARVAAGATVEAREGQDALVNPDGSYLLQSLLTKTGIDYARHLIAAKQQGTANEKAPQALPQQAQRGTAQQAEVTPSAIFGMSGRQLEAMQGGKMAGTEQFPGIVRSDEEIAQRKQLVEQRKAEQQSAVERAAQADPRIGALRQAGVEESVLLAAEREAKDGDDSLIRDLARINNVTLPASQASRPQGAQEGAQESGQGVGDELRAKLQAVERDILAAASPKFSVGGGDIEGAMRSLKVPKALKEQRKALKEQVRAAQQPRSDLDTVAERVTEPTHADPGQAPEAATAPVVAESIQKSAQNTPLDVKQAKAALLADIDRAIENVPAENAELAAELAQEKARKFKLSERVAKLAKGSIRDKLEREEGAAFDAMQADRIAKTAQQIGFVTLDVPGDGKFKVVNTVESLAAFRDKVKSSPGFREDPTTGMKLDPRPAGPTKKEQSDAINKAVKEGRRTEALDDLGNAIEIARLHGANDDPLLERFREIADKDYDAWRAEQDAEGEIAAREAGQSATPNSPEPRAEQGQQADAGADTIKRSFAGESARTADTHALATAQSRIAAGEDAETVRQDTGWFRGTDGKWRFEIDDSDAAILPALQSLGRGGYDAREIASVTYRKRDDGTYDLTLNPPSPKETSDFVTLTAVRPEVMRAVLPDAAARAVERNAGAKDFIGNFEEAKRVDAAFTFDGFNALPLDQVIDHPALFAAYPALREVMVQVDPKLGIGGAFSLVEHADGTTTQVIRIGKGQQLSTLLHEIQHSIQNVEGFATGGRPESFAHGELGSSETLRDAGNDLTSAMTRFSLADRNASRDLKAMIRDEGYRYSPISFGLGEKSDENGDIAAIIADFAQKRGIADLEAAADAYLAASEREVSPLSDVEAKGRAFEQYKRLAGETEARNTQARQKLTAAERRATSPEATADVKASDVIVVFNGTEMASAPAPANAAPMQSTGATPDAIWSAVESLVGPLRRRRIVVVQSADVLVAQGILQSRDANGAQAFVKDGKAYFIAGNIQPGNERAVFLHEVGAHLGMEKILSPLQRSVLLNRIKTWAAQANGSPESRIAQAAQRRVEAAGVTGQDAESELLAYFVEEAVKAGINPTTDTTGPIGQWFKTLWSALRTALEKLGLVNASKLTAQDIVNLAHGAANVAMSEEATGGATQHSKVDGMRRGTREQAEAMGYARAYRGVSQAMPFNDSGTVWLTTSRDAAQSYAEEVFGYDNPSVMEIWYDPKAVPTLDMRKVSEEELNALEPDEFGNPQKPGIYRNSDDSMLGGSGAGTVIHMPKSATLVVEDGGAQFSRDAMRAAGDTKPFANLSWRAETDDMLATELGGGWTATIYHGDGNAELQIYTPDGREFGEAVEYASIQTARDAAPAVIARRATAEGVQVGGTFSTSRIQFSRAAAIPNAEAASSKARDFLADVLKRPGTFGMLSRTLQTQYHKATKNPQFKAVWTRAHAMFMDASRAMSRPAELAPELLPKFDLSNMGKAAQAVFGRGQTERADIKAVADVLSAGTLAGGAGPMEGVVWGDKQLTEDGVRVGDKFVKLTAKQLALYKEARAAIDASLDESAAAEAWKLLRRHTTDADLRNWIAQNPQAAPDVVADTLATVIEQETAKLEDLKLAAQEAPSEAADKAVAKQEKVVADLKDTEERTAAIFDKAAALKEAGYMPLMRFGQYRIAVTTQGDNGEKIAYVSRYESAFEANRARRQLMQDFPASEGFTVGAVEVTDQDAWKQFKGVSPETVMLFAKESGIAADEVMQAWYKEAVASRSSLRRMVHRKGYQGFSDDLPRVLASFITSNGKAAGYAYHLADMQQMMQDETMPGDVHREARELLETITQPTEKGANVRGVMASWYLLGSIASAIVNSTQTLTMSLPFLSQFGKKGFAPGEAMSHLSRAYGQAFGKIKDKALADAVKRAEEAGIVDSNEVFHLYAEAMKPMIAKLGSGSVAYRARAFMTLWGAPFAIVEKLNRKSTFIAAYTMAKAQGKTDAQAFDFGERAVVETQGIYAVHNRPNWARGNVGGAILTFRQFSIAYLELAARMWQSGPEGKAAATMMLGILFLTAGLSGLPGEDDLLDIIDTFSQTFLGKSTVSKMELRNWLHDHTNKHIAEFINSGVSAFLPLDVSGRMGMGNLLPATALFKPSESDPKREMLEVLGVPGSFAMSAIDGAKLAMQGEGTAAIKAFAPKAVQDVVKGAEMLRTGEARDLRGRKIVDVGVADAFWQSIGFNPSVKAEAGRRAFEVNEMIGYNKRKESEIVGRLARGVADRDQEAIQSAQQDLAEWNQRNPETPILINRRQVQQRIMQLQMERSGRIVKMAPPELRRRVSEALEEE